MDRRTFVSLSGGGMLAASLGRYVETTARAEENVAGLIAPDYTVRIGNALVEVGPQCFLSMTAYNNAFPGPLLRFKEGRKVTVDIYNDTDTPEQLHWHGQFVPDSVDGAAEERTPYVPAHGMRREVFIPGPAGFRFYHTHIRAGSNLHLGQYGGEVGPVYIESKREPGDYDREVFLTLKEFEPFFSQGGDADMDFLLPNKKDAKLMKQGDAAMRASLAHGKKKGYEVGYRVFTVNGRRLGFGDPISVKQGEKVLFHILNGSATEIRSLALPGHTFTVTALDGNPVPHPARVPALWLGTAERISAIVEMNQPGVWVLGDLDDDDRRRGMGIVIEYANRRGKPVWEKPIPIRWDYRWFADPRQRSRSSEPIEVIEMVFAKENAADNGFNLWTINGTSFDFRTMPVTWQLRHGLRYRLRMRNASDDIHPIHMHRHSFELTRIAGKPTAGIIKDVAMLGGYQTMEVDFIANQRGLTLFHCHMQLHMDFGFMGLFETI